MSRFSLFLAGLAVLAFALGLSGCGPAELPPSEPAQQGPGEEHEHGEHEGHDEDEGHSEHEGHDKGERRSEHEAALADLSEADRALAEKQKVCPVSGEPLGSMGTPLKVTHQGRDLLLCCKMCKKKFDADPEKYLAKLPE